MNFNSSAVNTSGCLRSLVSALDCHPRDLAPIFGWRASYTCYFSISLSLALMQCYGEVHISKPTSSAQPTSRNNARSILATLHFVICIPGWQSYCGQTAVFQVQHHYCSGESILFLPGFPQKDVIIDIIRWQLIWTDFPTIRLADSQSL